MQSPSCADGCLADDVYLDIFTSWCLPARMLYCQNCMLCKYRHDQVVRFGDGNYSNLGSQCFAPQTNSREFCQIIFNFCDVITTYYYVAIITSLLQNHYCILLRIITYSNITLYYIIITFYSIIITKQLSCFITYYDKTIIMYYYTGNMTTT